MMRHSSRQTYSRRRQQVGTGLLLCLYFTVLYSLVQLRSQRLWVRLSPPSFGLSVTQALCGGVEATTWSHYERGGGEVQSS
jgi:hypothetical protein